MKLAENDSDILIKNLHGELHEKHANTMVDEKPNCLPQFGNIQR